MQWPAECVVVIPCLDEEFAIAPLVRAVRRQVAHIIVVDDGSSDQTAAAAKAAGAEVIRHASSLGKGAALHTGLRRAVDRGFTWALTMDGDGQHAADDIPAFLSEARHGSAGLVIGNRMGNAAPMPWLRRQVNRWMSRRISSVAGIWLPDSQCGFRLIKLSVWSSLPIHASHFEIESEMLLAFVCRGSAVKFIPVQTIYKNEHSKIRPVRDTVRWLRWWLRARRNPVHAAANCSSAP
jgi:glycosyltransferase involved in cell wall biosynthesis